MSWITEKPEGILLTIFVQPRSSKNMITGLHGDALKLKLTAPPVNNAANDMCIQFFSKQLKVAKSSLEIVSGHTSRLKQILVRTADDRKSIIEKIESLSV